jgi:hypothetical protein
MITRPFAESLPVCGDEKFRYTPAPDCRYISSDYSVGIVPGRDTDKNGT